MYAVCRYCCLLIDDTCHLNQCSQTANSQRPSRLSTTRPSHFCDLAELSCLPSMKHPIKSGPPRNDAYHRASEYLRPSPRVVEDIVCVVTQVFQKQSILGR